MSALYFCVKTDASVIQLAQGGHPAVYPVLLGPVRGQFDGEDVVGRVARGGQGAPPGTCFIDWTLIYVLVQKRCTSPGLQPNDGQWVIEDFGERLLDLLCAPVPASAF